VCPEAARHWRAFSSPAIASPTSRWPWKQVSPTSEKDLARRRKRLIDAGMRTWYGSRINDTTLAELVAAMGADDYIPEGSGGPLTLDVLCG